MKSPIASSDHEGPHPDRSKSREVAYVNVKYFIDANSVYRPSAATVRFDYCSNAVAG